MSTCSDSRVDAPEAAAAEIEVTPVWEAFIFESSGFVMSSHEALDEIIEEFPDEARIASRWGDVFPYSIEIVTDSARPKPQSPGSPFLRGPGSWATTDKIFEYDLEQVETSEDLREIWERAKAMAEGLNAYEARRGAGED